MAAGAARLIHMAGGNGQSGRWSQSVFEDAGRAHRMGSVTGKQTFPHLKSDEARRVRKCERIR